MHSDREVVSQGLATDTIDYVATDTWGNTATSTRTVIIEAAPSTVPIDEASTTTTTGSVKRVDLAGLFNRKVSRHRQRAPLVGFQGDLLGQHDVTCYEIVFRYEAPARSRPASAV